MLGKLSTDELDLKIGELLNHKTLHEADCKALCEAAIPIFTNEPTVQTLEPPLTVVGDIHGQFDELKELLRITGMLPDTNFLFLGDYVDRGVSSVECLTLILALKIRYPTRITLIRGNHESRQITQVYGFYDETLNKFGSVGVWSLFAALFDTLPLAATIGTRIFSPHAGLSPSIDTLDEIRVIHRFVEPPHEGPMCDLMWSDPHDAPGWGMSPRGAGFIFGEEITKRFNHRNGLRVIARAHQMMMDGFQWHHDDGVVTLFSAANYCYRCGNLGGFMELDDKLNYTLISFAESPSQKGRKSGGARMPDYFL